MQMSQMAPQNEAAYQISSHSDNDASQMLIYAYKILSEPDKEIVFKSGVEC